MADDFSSATFSLRPNARFHDGSPITPEDVIFSLSALKAAHPRYALQYKNVVKAEKTGPHEVTFVFDRGGNRELPQTVGGLPVLPRHFWQAKGADGEPRDVSRSTMEVPLGSGPYRVKKVDAGRSIVYERVKDWWAKDLPVTRGQWNFGEIQYIYYRDRVPGFEEFKNGKTDFWAESSAKAWATQYDFDAVARGLVKK
jgi:microcin C transport system substrate-binding protein